MNDMFGLIFVPVVVVLVMLLNGIIGHWVASHWLSDRESKIAGFAFSCGGGLAGAIDSSFGEKWAILAGAVIGLALLWSLFFKREAQNG